MLIQNFLTKILFFLAGYPACLFITAAAKRVKASAIYLPLIIEITVTIYKFTLLVAIAGAGLVCALSPSGASAYRNMILEVIFITGILTLILHQIHKQPEYPAANHS